MDTTKMIIGLMFLAPFLYILQRNFPFAFEIVKIIIGAMVGFLIVIMALMGMALFFTGLFE